LVKRPFDLEEKMKFLRVSKSILMIAFALAVMGQGDKGLAGAETGKGTVPSASDLSGYCDSAIGILVRAKRIAREQFADGDLAGSRNTLVQGLVKALASFGNVNDMDAPLTKLSIVRGIDLNSAFQDNCGDDQQCLGLQARTALFFMGKYYDYILGPVASLDRQYYIPYVTRYHHCRSYECLPADFGNEFFVAYKSSAEALLNFYNGQDPRSGLPDTLAKDVYELNVAERVLGWAAEDLNNDLWRRSFACLIQELSDGSQDIAAFNSGDSSQFKTSRRAVLFSRDISQEAASDLRRSDGCVIYPVWR
jgi:hypothetical protein